MRGQLIGLDLRFNKSSLFVAELAADDDDKVDDCPDAKAASGDEHEEPCTDLTNIEAVDPECSKKEGEENGCNETFRAFFHLFFSL